MDRSAAGALLGMAIVLSVCSGLAWLAESPFERYPQIVTGPGSEPQPLISLDDPPDTGTVLLAVAVEGFRKAPLLVAGVALVLGVVVWVRAAPDVSCPVPSRVYATLAPLIVAAALGAMWFTPPDIITTLMLLGAQLVLYVPMALLLLAAVSRVRSRKAGGA